MSQKSILVIGSGGREHAICWKLSQSKEVKNVFVAPGNCGMALEPKVSLIKLDINDNKTVAEWCKENEINLVVVGPEAYLANGLSDELKKNQIPCFGPEKLGAQIETDKNWAKAFMDRHKIPTANWKSFTDPEEAKKFIKTATFKALVVKASGLAAGKGVVVAENNDEACKAVDEILGEKKFGSAGETIVVEELLEGEEVSLLAFTDGKTVVNMLPAQDHKRIFDNDLGPNTGGVGAYCPCPFLNEKQQREVKENILQKTIDGLRMENIPFVGVLYAGLMITESGPKVLEFNCRFGDPETQILLPLLNSDLFTIMMSCCEGTLDENLVSWRRDIFGVGVILASKGYPESSSKGEIITGVENSNSQRDCLIFHSGTNLSPTGDLLTNGGRVLIAASLSSSLASAAAKATSMARNISFDGKQFRTDIAHKGIARSILEHGELTYKSSGVNIEAGDSFVENIKKMVSSTKRTGLLGSIGGFGGLFDAKVAGYQEPLLVSGTDGVGTKLKIAFECDKHNSVGIDLVAMCVNDVLAHGAEPLFFLDYFACGKLNIERAAEVVSGIVEGCKQAGCALVGGETAEMPEMYKEGEYDLAGFAVGAVEKNHLMPRRNDMKSNDIVIGLPSSGIHSNGFSLVRKIMKLADKSYDDQTPFSNKTFGEEFLTPTKIYSKGVLPALRTNLVKGFAHITGGGLTENIPRILPENIAVSLNAKKWKIPSVFGWLATVGGINKAEMLRTFNCGIGAVLVCAPEDETMVLEKLKGENPIVIGKLTNINDDNVTRVEVNNFEVAMDREMRKHVKPLVEKLSKPLKKVGVLISGSGTNLQALIDATLDPLQHIGAEIVLVISNKPDVEGLKRAQKFGIPTKVIKHTNYPTREEFDEAMDVELRNCGVEIVCLAGFMRILSAKFVHKWKGKLLNVHPSLLPSFKGSHAHKDVLAAGVRVSGCTVHFVEVDIDSGAIIEQETVRVLPNDTEETLQERVKKVEHLAFPKALKHLATERISLRNDGTLEWRF